MFLGGCPCCGKKECWRCYKVGCAEITGSRWLGAIPDKYSDAFRLNGYGIDTDARPPDRQNGNSFIAWDGPPFDIATYNVSNIKNEPIIQFFVGNTLADNRQRQFAFSINSCVKIDGENNYDLQFYNLSGDSPELAIVKHVSKDGLETIVNTGNFPSSFYIPMSSESPFFLGQYVAEYADGGTAVIELKDIYQLLQGVDHEYQCFDAPPDEEGWLPVGKCHATEEECAKECGPCWRCYGKYGGDWPICNNEKQCVINGQEVYFPSFISFKSSLTVGEFANGNVFDYDIAGANEWLASLDFRFLLEMTSPAFDYYDVKGAYNHEDCLQIRDDLWLGSKFADVRAGSVQCGMITGESNSQGRVTLSCSSFELLGAETSNGLLVRNCDAGENTSYGISIGRSKQFQLNATSLRQSFTIDGASASEFQGLSVQLYQCAPNGGTIRSASYYLKGSAEVSFDFLPAGKTGSCCLRNGDCENTTAIQCIDKCGIFTPDATCEDNPCVVVEAEEYQCFDAPPDEDGWTPVGSTHVDEATCNAACPSDTTTPPGGRTMTTTTGGPGTELKKLLGSFGIRSKEKGCGCRSYQKKMDKGGPQWCRDHKQEIIDHLAKEAKKRKLPFIRLAAEKLVELAIRRAEKDST